MQKSEFLCLRTRHILHSVLGFFPKKGGYCGLCLVFGCSFACVTVFSLFSSTLPANISSPPTPSPVTPQSRSSRQKFFMTRRSSSIQGRAFTIQDFEIGETLGAGFFGEAVKVGLGEALVTTQLLKLSIARLEV